MTAQPEEDGPMRQMISAVGVAATLMLVGACGVLDEGLGEAGSGNLQTIEPEVAEFTRLQAESSFDVAVRVGDGFDLVVRADDNVIDDVEASVSGDTLTLGLDGRYREVTLEAELAVPADALSEIRASGASSVTGSDELASDDFDIDASGASTVTLRLDTEDLTAHAEGASTVEVTGSGVALDADAQGASTLRLARFTAASVTARADGASTIEVTASESLDASAAGASTIRYSGSPSAVSQDSSGASTIEPA
jgi:hypothetical protein